MSHRRFAVLALAAVLAAATLALPACAGGSGHQEVHATATFDDVADLAVGAPVMLDDITIGQVRSIHLDPSGARARVDLAFRRSADVPADVEAQLRRTTPLGEKFVDLEPQTTDPHAPLLASGATIRRTKVVSDLEQLVSSGTATFGALSASQLAILLDEGAQSFGGKGPQLHEILSRLADVAHGYAGHTGSLTSVIDDLDHLAGQLAPHQGVNDQALTDLAQTLGTLQANDDRFFVLVRSLDRVADDGKRILSEHLGQIQDQIKGLRTVTGALAQEQVALGQLLVNLHRHNETVPQAERGHFVNALLDVILCGIPGGGDQPGSPANACYPGGQGAKP